MFGEPAYDAMVIVTVPLFAALVVQIGVTVRTMQTSLCGLNL